MASFLRVTVVDVVRRQVKDVGAVKEL